MPKFRKKPVVIEAVRYYEAYEDARGTADEPVVRDDVVPYSVYYTLDHLHNSEGDCLKNRFGARCDNARSRAIDAAHLERQRAWSRTTFGPGPRTLGVLDHIRKELLEIEADPTDLREWIDVVILAFDGAWRAGWEPQQIIDAVHEKQQRNEQRSWPDWRTRSEDSAIEHVREGES